MTAGGIRRRAVGASIALLPLAMVQCSPPPPPPDPVTCVQVGTASANFGLRCTAVRPDLLRAAHTPQFAAQARFSGELTIRTAEPYTNIDNGGTTSTVWGPPGNHPVVQSGYDTRGS